MPVPWAERLARRAVHAVSAASRSVDDARVAVEACRTAAQALCRFGEPERAVELLGHAVVANAAADDAGVARIDPPTRGFSVLLPYRDYVTLSVAIGIYSSV